MTESPSAATTLGVVLKLMTRADLARELGVQERTIRRWTKATPAVPERWGPRLREILRHRTVQSPERAGAFTFIDLFAGIGGIRSGFEQAGGHCVFSSEWDRFALQTYRANFGNEDEVIQEDIREITASSHDADENSRRIAEQIPDHDVLLAGFPCQPFSLAGVSKKNSLGVEHGFMCEAQGTLFFDVARILEVKKPKAFLLENVKNLRSHDRGRTYALIRKVLEEDLGYQVFDNIIDGKGFVPQHRERIYMVGFRGDTPPSFSWEQMHRPESGAKTLRDIFHPEDGGEDPEEPYTHGPLALVSSKYVLSQHLWQYLQDYRRKHKAAGNGFGFSLVGPSDTARTLSARYHKDGSEILVDRGGRAYPRRLTPRECARLMGYPDDFRIPVSDTQAYRQFGNSVVVPVIAEIARLMVPEILAAIESSKSTPQLTLPMELLPG